MGSNNPKPQRGDIISYNIVSSNSSVKGSAKTLNQQFGLRHYGVMVSDDTIISKYDAETSPGAEVLMREKLDEGGWTGVRIEKSGGEGCARHAENRFNDGAIVDNDINKRKDKYRYSLLNSNCQHFANDCYLQEDGKGSCDDIFRIVWKAILAALANAGMIYCFAKGIGKKNSFYSEGFIRELNKDFENGNFTGSGNLKKVFNDQGYCVCNFQNSQTTFNRFEDFANYMAEHQNQEVNISVFNGKNEEILLILN